MIGAHPQQVSATILARSGNIALDRQPERFVRRDSGAVVQTIGTADAIRWHAIETTLYGEDMAAASILAAGAQVIYPRILERIAMPRGKFADVPRPFWPGYVLAGWVVGYDWGHVRRARGVERVVNKIGERYVPAILSSLDVGALQASMSLRGIVGDEPVELPEGIEPAPARGHKKWTSLAGLSVMERREALMKMVRAA